MLVVRIDLQLACHGSTELGMRKHANNGLFHDQLRLALHAIFEVFFAQPARISGIAAIDLLLALHAGDFDLAGVDDDDVVAGIDERRVLRIIFASKDASHTGSKTAKGLPRGVDDVPFARNFPRFGEMGGHNNLPNKLKNKTNQLKDLRKSTLT